MTTHNEPTPPIGSAAWWERVEAAAADLAANPPTHIPAIAPGRGGKWSDFMARLDDAIGDRQ